MAYNELPSYSPIAGSTSIVTSGTITSGTWSATAIDVTHGGTGQTTLTNHGVLVGNATTAITQLAAGSAGQALLSGGAGGPAYSTATYPTIATGTGKILRADGTNWLATTATFPSTAGTSGNVLTSDGTNWSSAAPSGGTASYVQNMTVVDSANPIASTTYYIRQGSWANTNASSATNRLYFPSAGTITKIYGAFTVNTTLASAQNCTLSLTLNNSSDTTISSTLQFNAIEVPFNATVSIAISAGDYVTFKLATGAWTTAPTNVFFSGSVLIG